MSFRATQVSLKTFSIVWILCQLGLAQPPNSSSMDKANLTDKAKLPSSQYPSYRGEFSDEPPTQRYRSTDYAYSGREYAANGQYRQPIALLPLDGSRMLVATKLTGELFQIDASPDSDASTNRTVFADPAMHFGDLCYLTKDLIAATALITDGGAANGRVLILRRENDQTWRIQQTLSVTDELVDVAFDAESNRLAATGLWSHRLFVWEAVQTNLLEFSDNPIATDLPFAGGQLAFLGLQEQTAPEHLLVSDAMGNGIVVLNWKTQRILKYHSLHDHNITKLVISHDGTFVGLSCQLLNEFIPTVRGEITWGAMISNNSRWIRAEKLLHSDGEAVYSGSLFKPLGAVGNGSGTPTCLAVSPNGQIAVTAGGSNRVALPASLNDKFQFLATGMYPVACAFTSTEDQLVIANQFDDSLTIVNLAEMTPRQVELGALRPPTLVELGEQKFHDTGLSHDNWMSCASCHVRGHSSGLLNDNLTDHTQGTPKRVLTLLGQADTAPYSWLGEQATLEKQVEHSIRSTMASDHEVDHEDVVAISAYVRTLKTPPSVLAARANGQFDEDTKRSIARGKQLFEQQACGNCHAGQHYTTPDTYAVGLVDEASAKHFNPPSLLGVSQRESGLFHDGRAKSLEEVLEKYKHQVSDTLDQSQRLDLITFLRSL